MGKECVDAELEWDRNGVRGHTAAPEGDHVLYPPPVCGFGGSPHHGCTGAVGGGEDQDSSP